MHLLQLIEGYICTSSFQHMLKWEINHVVFSWIDMLPEQMHELNGIVEVVSYMLASETKKLLNLIPMHLCQALCRLFLMQWRRKRGGAGGWRPPERQKWGAVPP